MILNCYVIDDEEHAVVALSKYIKKTPGLILTGAETNPLKALDKISSNTLEPDVVFLDIDMPQISGMEVAKLLSPNVQIIFSTGHANYAVKAFEQNALDYLLKPITYERFIQSVNKAKENFFNKTKANHGFAADYIFIQNGKKGAFVKIPYNDIKYIKADSNYVKIYKEGGEKEPLVTYLTMEEVSNKLPANIFMRVHKSFIVNLQKIITATGEKITLEPDIIITVGRSYQKDFLQLVNSALLKSKRKK